MNRCCLLIILFCCLGHHVVGQARDRDLQTFPEVGKTCPDITVYHIEGFKDSTASVKSFQGKWLVLDFWTKSCTVCIASLPKVQNMAESFKDKVQFMMVAKQDKEQQIVPLFHLLKKRVGFTVPCAFDSLLFNRLKVESTPYIIVVDPNGIVRAFTESLTETQMGLLIQGKEAHLRNYYRSNESAKSINEQTVEREQGKNISLFNSSISFSNDPNAPIHVTTNLAQAVSEGKLLEQGVPLFRLYNLAYFGKYLWNDESAEYGGQSIYPVLEMRDSGYFKTKHDGAGLFSMAINMLEPGTTQELLMNFLQTQLCLTFGYAAELETRKMPYWKLILTDTTYRNKLVTKGGEKSFKGLPHGSFSARNYPLKKILSKISYELNPTLPFINETSINGNIDIDMNCIMSDLEDVRKALKENGLDLVKSEKDMRVIVIRDK